MDKNKKSGTRSLSVSETRDVSPMKGAISSGVASCGGREARLLWVLLRGLEEVLWWGRMVLEWLEEDRGEEWRWEDDLVGKCWASRRSGSGFLCV